MGLNIFQVTDENADTEDRGERQEVVGRFRAGYQVGKRPIGLQEFRVTSPDPAVCGALAAMFGTAQGHPEYWRFKKTGRPTPGHVNSNWAIRAMYERRQKERYA